ncbi:MAG: polyketide cyclase, partial [Candidimonas sp.]
MEDSGFKPGRIQRLEDCFEGRLEHFYAHDQDAVWRMLTEPQSLAQWLAGGTIELRIGGAVRIDFEDSGRKIDSTVLALEPRRLL